MLNKISCLFLVVFLVQSLAAETITRVAGRVSDRIVTTREVILNSLIEDVIYRPKAPKQIQSLPLTHQQFIREVNAVLLEWAISIDGETLSQMEIGDDRVESEFKRAKSMLRKSETWQLAGGNDQELRSILIRKMKTKKIIEAKLNTTNIPITDLEAKEYFEANRHRFDNSNFLALKENIKSFIAKEQSAARMREWFELLQLKYKVRNYLTEERS